MLAHRLSLSVFGCRAGRRVRRHGRASSIRRIALAREAARGRLAKTKYDKKKLPTTIRWLTIALLRLVQIRHECRYDLLLRRIFAVASTPRGERRRRIGLRRHHTSAPQHPPSQAATTPMSPTTGRRSAWRTSCCCEGASCSTFAIATSPRRRRAAAAAYSSRCGPSRVPRERRSDVTPTPSSCPKFPATPRARSQR